MKVFLKYFAVPLIIALIAGGLFVIDALIGSLFVSGASFTWVGFVGWTVFYTAKLKDRAKGFIGVIFGFVCAVLMMLISSLFTLNLHTISISGLLGVVVINFMVIAVTNVGDKIWLSSASGVFVGMFLTFSGLGVGLSAVANVGEAFLMLGIILVYVLLGLVCGFLSILGDKKVKERLAKIENKNIEENKKEEK